MIELLFFKPALLTVLFMLITIINAISFIRSDKSLYMFDNINVFMEYVLYIIIITLLLIELSYVKFLIIPVVLTGVVLFRIGQTIYEQYTTNN